MKGPGFFTAAVLIAACTHLPPSHKKKGAPGVVTKERLYMVQPSGAVTICSYYEVTDCGTTLKSCDNGKSYRCAEAEVINPETGPLGVPDEAPDDGYGEEG